jgi:uncharacterized membrane protein
MTRLAEIKPPKSVAHLADDLKGAGEAPWIAIGIAGGSAVGFYALARRSKAVAALAALGTIGVLQARRALQPRRERARATAALNCSPQNAYQFWRNLENIPRFMRALDSVRDLGNGRLELTIRGPMDAKLRWVVEIVEDRENERIECHTVPGSQIEAKGLVDFRPATAERGTIATVKVRYRIPAGALGKAAAAAFAGNPRFTVREDLRRFKALVEAGEIPTTAGQPSGPRGLQGRGSRVLLRETKNIAPPQAEQAMRPAV